LNKYIVKWNAGWGERYAEVEAINEFDASYQAAVLCEEEFDNKMEYDVMGLSTDKLKKEFVKHGK